MAKTRQEGKGATMVPFSGFTAEEFPDLRAVSSQSSKTDVSKNTISTVWSAPLEASGRPFAAMPPSVKPTNMKTNSQIDCVGGVSTQISTAECSRPTTSSLVTNLEPSGRPLTPISPSGTPAMMTSKMADNDVAPPSNFTADSFANTISSAWSTSLKPSVRLSTPVPSAKPAIITCQAAGKGASPQSSTKDGFTNTTSAPWPKQLEPPGRSSTPVTPITRPATMTMEIHGSAVPPMKTCAVPSCYTFNNPREIPKDVYVVCDHFLFENRKRPASIYDKCKACKGCENRSRLKYAVWSDNTKQWELIRPYPAKYVPAKVAFKECKQYSANRPCLKTPCSFAHGQQELVMWTMEREGSKFSRRLSDSFLPFTE